MSVTNPKALGLVQDELKPGGKLTGVTTGGSVISKGFEWLLTTAPSIKRVHIFYHKGDLTAPSHFPMLRECCEINVLLAQWPVRYISARSHLDRRIPHLPQYYQCRKAVC